MKFPNPFFPNKLIQIKLKANVSITWVIDEIFIWLQQFNSSKVGVCIDKLFSYENARQKWSQKRNLKFEMNLGKECVSRLRATDFCVKQKLIHTPADTELDREAFVTVIVASMKHSSFMRSEGFTGPERIPNLNFEKNSGMCSFFFCDILMYWMTSLSYYTNCRDTPGLRCVSQRALSRGPFSLKCVHSLCSNIHQPVFQS